MKPFLVLSLALLTLPDGFAAEVNGPPRPQPTGLWAALYTEDIPTFAANLRNAGCPEATVGLLVSQEVNARFKDREEALQPSTVSAQSLQAQFSRERREALVQLRLEKNTVLRAVLGVVPGEIARFDWTPGALARLTAGEREVVRMITDDYDTMIARILTESQGHLLDEDREKLRFLEAERANDLGKLLSAEEILDFELVRTEFGRSTVTHLKYFIPSQDQMRTVLMVAKKHGLDFEGTNANPTRLAEDRQAINAELAALWKPEVYARYRKTTSDQYRMIYRLVQRLNLGRGEVDVIFDSQKATTERGLAMYVKWRQSINSAFKLAGRSTTYLGSSDPRHAAFVKQMQLVLQEHLDLVQISLGDVGFKEYFEQNRRWIEAMLGGGVPHMSYSI